MAVMHGALAIPEEDLKILESIIREAEETIQHHYHGEEGCPCPLRSAFVMIAIKGLLGIDGRTIKDTALALSNAQLPESLQLIDLAGYEVHIDMPPSVSE
jgi:hypothetical protein